MRNTIIDTPQKNEINDQVISCTEPNPILRVLIEDLRRIVGVLNECNHEITEKISILHTPTNQLYIESTGNYPNVTVIEELGNLIFKLDCISQHAQNNNKHLSTII